jgi:hypothetical protein
MSWDATEDVPIDVIHMIEAEGCEYITAYNIRDNIFVEYDCIKGHKTIRRIDQVEYGICYKCIKNAKQREILKINPTILKCAFIKDKDAEDKVSNDTSKTPNEKLECIINLRNGKLNKIYRVGKRRYVNFTCNNGHTLDKRADQFRKTWCLKCTINTIDMAHELAKKRDGKFLSAAYINSHTKYEWECKNKHKFMANYTSVHQGTWCRKCHMIDYNKIKELIESKGGTLLTEGEDFKGSKVPLEVKCKDGHLFKPLINSLYKNSWCRTCQDTISERTCRSICEFIYKKKFDKKRPLWLHGTIGRLELDGYCEELNIAFEYNGEQHYKFVPYWHKTQKRFGESIIRDKEKEKLCIENNTKLIIISYTVKYEDLYTYILSIAPNVPDNTPTTITYDQLELGSINDDKLKMVADYIFNKWEGKILSKIYSNNTTLLDFECKNNHKFKQTWSAITSGIFCKECNKNIRQKSMKSEKIAEFETSRNYMLLEPYTSAKAKLKWKCTICETEYIICWDSMRLRTPHCIE